jgi:site-specific DNA recombinase
MKAALYARYSTDQQRAASIEDQFRNCRSRAAAEGWQITATFADQAMSGGDSNRPDYQAMLAAASRKQFDVLLVDDLSRLSRDQVESERVIRRLEFNGIRILAVTDGYDTQTQTATRKIQRGVKNLINEMRLDELREQIHRGMMGQAIKRYWCGGRPYGYRLRPILDGAQLDAYGQPARIGTVLEIDAVQAQIVAEIFARFVAGASCRTVARELNSRRVPSPGSRWKRIVRRSHGWMGSGVRVILKNPLYTGRVRWNVSQFVRDPDTGKHQRRLREKRDWVEHRDEKLRIVSNELFEQAQTRTCNPDARLSTRGKAKYLLSGLLVCGRCGANYVIVDPRRYACSGYWNGGACSNSRRIRREAIEEAILDPIRSEVLSPERVAHMASEMQKFLSDRAAGEVVFTANESAELHELETRLERLRRRLAEGDPDLTDDELQAAIDCAELKQHHAMRVAADKEGRHILSALPKAADLRRAQLALGQAGDLRAAQEARTMLRRMIPGRVTLVPEPAGRLWAEFGVEPTALLIDVMPRAWLVKPDLAFLQPVNRRLCLERSRPRRRRK